VKIKKSAFSGKNKYKTLFFCLASAIFLAVFFVYHSVKAQTVKIIINEVQISGGTGKTTQDFVELYNVTDAPVNLNGFKLKKKTRSNPSESYLVSAAGFSGYVIPSNGYFLISTQAYKDIFNADISFTSAGYSVADDNTILLYNGDGNLVDKVGYGLAGDYETLPATMPGAGESIERKNFQDTGNNKEDFEIADDASPTSSGCLENPERCFIEKDKAQNLSDDLIITELLPYPSDGDEEYVELYNGSDKDLNLDGWTLHDASQSGEYIFSATESIDSKKYFVIYKSDFGFALNNSGLENITLFDPNKKEVCAVSYSGSKKDVSYNFDGKDWHWSKFLTPEKENKFENVLLGKLDVDKNVYQNVYADFKIGGLLKDAKVAWNFGDGHKSYKQKAQHKYEKTGKYEASVKYAAGSEDVVKNFTVEVKKIPHPEVSIVAVNANPEGSDTDNESITIKNKSKGKINFIGWSIATGWKKLYNHPITVDFEIKAGKEKEITREYSKFTLNNEKTKIEIRYPDGKVAYDKKYNKKNGIEEGELYVKIKGGWSWEAEINQESRITNQEKIVSHQSLAISNQEIDSHQTSIIINQKEIGDQLENVIQIENIRSQTKTKKENRLIVNYNNIFKIESSSQTPRVLGVESVREIDGVYHLVPQSSAQEHYAIVFFKKIFVLTNLKINLAINTLFR
jgi:hypothetical protein